MLCVQLGGFWVRRADLMNLLSAAGQPLAGRVVLELQVLRHIPAQTTVALFKVTDRFIVRAAGIIMTSIRLLISDSFCLLHAATENTLLNNCLDSFLNIYAYICCRAMT